MKRRLRIAGSVFFALVAIAFVVLWVGVTSPSTYLAATSSRTINATSPIPSAMTNHSARLLCR
jgi:hypothetical protein